MAVGWVAIIPWKEVLKAAPEIIIGAKKLWNAVSRTPSPSEPPPQPADGPISPEGQTLSELNIRIGAVESISTTLQTQMEASSELIKILADQNGQLVARVEAHRKHLLWLTSVAAAALVASVMCLVLLLAKST